MQTSALLGETSEIITAEVPAAADRIIASANGVLVDPQEQTDPSAKKIYAVPPHQVALEFIINQTLGIPGAKIEIYRKDDGSEEVKYLVPVDPVTGKDHTELYAICERKFQAAIPMAIERLKELSAGITVQSEHQGKQITITRAPSARAIEYIASRVTGASTSILDAIDESQKAEADTGYFDLSTDACSEPQKFEPQSVVREGLPEYMNRANLELAKFLPTAIKYMTVLASGACTTVQIENECTTIQHNPDLRANIFLLNRFIGTPVNRVKVPFTPARQHNRSV